MRRYALRSKSNGMRLKQKRSLLLKTNSQTNGQSRNPRLRSSATKVRKVKKVHGGHLEAAVNNQTPCSTEGLNELALHAAPVLNDAFSTNVGERDNFQFGSPKHCESKLRLTATPQPPMIPALIRVYEDRMVHVTVMRRENSNTVPVGTPSATARMLALSVILASAAALSPMCSFSSDSSLPLRYASPFSYSRQSCYHGMNRSPKRCSWTKTPSTPHQTIPFVAAAATAAAAADVVFYRAMFFMTK